MARHTVFNRCLFVLTATSSAASDAAAVADSSFLSDWMGHSAPLISNVTLLDLALPGSHDTMTYDLSSALSDGYEGMPEPVSKILHSLTPLVAGQFIRDQGRTQGTNITAQLEGGLRFLDFRTLLSGAKGGKMDWFCLHGCQTNHPSLDYLRQVRSWLDAHPREMIVIWISRHGDVSLNGTKQYPGTSVAQRRAYWQQIQSVFDGKLVDSSHGTLNQVSMAEHWSVGAQVAVYATDYEEFTGSSTHAIDAMLIDNNLGGSSSRDFPKGISDGLGCFSPGTRASDKSTNRFYLVSMADGGQQIGQAAEIRYVPFAKDAATKACAKIYNVPNMTGWCPLTLMDQVRGDACRDAQSPPQKTMIALLTIPVSQGLLVNYYNQYTLEAAYQGMKINGTYEFPNAM